MKGISLTTASWSLSVSFLSFLSDSKSDRRKYNMESFWKFGFAELSDIGAQKMASLVFFCKSFNSTPIFSCCASPHVPTFFSDGQVSEKSMNKFPPCSPPGEFKTWPPAKLTYPSTDPSSAKIPGIPGSICSPSAMPQAILPFHYYCSLPAKAPSSPH